MTYRKNSLRIIASIFIILFLVACGTTTEDDNGTTIGTTIKDDSDTTAGGNNSDDDNTGGNNSDDDNTGGDNTGGDNTGGDNTGGGNTGGGNTGGNNPSATVLSWQAPSLNDDGTILTDLAGHKLYYGTESGNYTQVIDVGNQTSITLQNLTSGTTYYFSIVAYDNNGNESNFSSEISKAI